MSEFPDFNPEEFPAFAARPNDPYYSRNPRLTPPRNLGGPRPTLADVGHAATNALPFATAAGLALAVPEVGIPSMLVRGGVAALGSLPGLAAKTAIRGGGMDRFLAEAPGQMVEQGTNQVAGDALGALPGKAVGAMRAAAPDMMGEALNPGKRMLAGFRHMAQTALDEKVPLGGKTLPGTNEITSRLEASHQAENAIASQTRLRDYGTRKDDRMWRPSAILQQVKDRMDAGLPKNARLGIEDSPEWKDFEQRFMSTYTDNPEDWMKASQPGARGPERPFDLEDMLVAKRGADRAAADAHVAAMERAGLKDRALQPTIDERIAKNLADVFRENIRKSVPELGEQMLRSRDLVNLERAYLQAEARPSGLSGIGASKEGVGKGLMQMMFSPQASSRRAISFSKASAPAGAREALKTLPRLASYTILPDGRVVFPQEDTGR